MDSLKSGGAEQNRDASPATMAAVDNKVGRRRVRLVVALVALPIVLGLVSLGVWQIERRAWKLDLIERVDARIHAPAEPAPDRSEWLDITRERDEYRHVSLAGTYLHERETLVQALTERGGGFWVLTPLQQADGTKVLVNRGFVPSDRVDAQMRREGQPSGPVEISGLLRLSEPGGRLLRPNDAGADKWYSRDVSAIAERRGLSEVAPYFVDADARPVPGGYPIGGLTVVRFNNNHLVYALTWFVLAGMLTAAVVYVWRHGDRSER